MEAEHPSNIQRPRGAKKVFTVTANNKCTQVCSVPSLTCHVTVWVSHLIPYLLKHKQVQHSLTVIYLICIRSICLASLRLDSAKVETESPQQPRNLHALRRSLLPVLS